MTLWAQSSENAGNVQLIDRIVAVVGNDIILMSDVRTQIRNLIFAKKIDEDKVNDRMLNSMFREAIQDMVNEQLLLVKAAQDSIQVDRRQVDSMEKEELANIKKQFASEEEFKKSLEEVGLSEQQLRGMLWERMRKTFLQETLMQKISSNLIPTSREKEEWFNAHKDSLPDIPDQYKFSHILIYPKISDAKKQQIREQLKGILTRIQNGEDFAKLAKEYSQDTGTAPDGGDLGFFTAEEMNPDFSKVAFSLQPGEVSDIVETQLATRDGIQFGFHIIKVEEVRGERVRARHILLLAKPDEEDDQHIIENLTKIRDDIISGKSTFEEMAKQYSEDENSRNQGGKLPWLAKDQGIIKPFLEQSATLKKGDISMPFKSQFGYHILRLDDYKQGHALNLVDDNQIITQLVAQEKKMQELDRILDKLKQETYIDIRLE